jgi:hypothetical protein
LSDHNGTADSLIVVKAITNLANPALYPLQMVNPGATRYTQWTNYPTRFYRLR